MSLGMEGFSKPRTCTDRDTVKEQTPHSDFVKMDKQPLELALGSSLQRLPQYQKSTAVVPVRGETPNGSLDILIPIFLACVHMFFNNIIWHLFYLIFPFSFP